MKWIPLQLSKHTQVLSTCRFPLKRASPKKKDLRQKAKGKKQSKNMTNEGKGANRTKIQSLLQKLQYPYTLPIANRHLPVRLEQVTQKKTSRSRNNSRTKALAAIKCKKDQPVWNKTNNNKEKVHKAKCLLTCHFKTRTFPIFFWINEEILYAQPGRPLINMNEKRTAVKHLCERRRIKKKLEHKVAR